MKSPKPKAKSPAKIEPTTPPATPAPTTETVEIWPVEKVLVSELNTRQPTEAEVKRSGLVDAIRAAGQSTPAIARPHPTKEGCLELAAGARRRTACAVLGIPLKVIVRQIPDGDFEDLIFTENFQRQDPDPLMEAQLVARRLAEGADEKQIAARYGQTPLWVKRRAALTRLDPAIVKAWRKPDSGFAHWDVEMMEHLALFDPAQQKEMVGGNWRIRQCRNITQLRKESAAESTCELDKADFLTDPRTALKDCGPEGCAHSTAGQTSLFGFATDGKGKGTESPRCLKPQCFCARKSLAMDAALADLVAKRGIDPSDVVAIFYEGHRTHGNATHIGDSTYNIVSKWDMKCQEMIAIPAKDKIKPGTPLAIDTTSMLAPKLYRLKLAKGSPAAKKAAKAKAKAAGGGDDMAEKIAVLQSRRWAAARTRVVKALEKAELPELYPAQWVILAGTFGTRSNEGYIPDKAPKEDIWATFNPDDAQQDCFPQCEHLWNEIRPILVQRLTRVQRAEDFRKPHVLAELQGVASLINFDLVKAKADIDLTELPIPKIWPRGLDPHTLQPATVASAVNIDDEE